MLRSAPAKLSRVLLALAALSALATRARAEEDTRGLEKRFRELAKASIPKTVCVKSYVEAHGDKAGYGSGAIVSPDGYVLTCAHVVDIAKRVEVILSDGTAHTAKIMGRNKRQDYALLKVEAKDLDAYKIGDSTKVKVGDWVMALGHPGGPYADLKPAFSAGRVTGLHKRLPVQFFDRFYDDAIQTDVPIFAGNSGGPLVSLSGELIGLNGAILIINENAYAIPIQEVMGDYAALQRGENIAGKQATQEDLAQLQREIGPEQMQKLFDKAFKNFGKMFGGEGNEGLAKLFEQFGKMFNGGGGGDENGGKGQNPDLQKMLEQFQKMFGGNGGEDENGEKGQNPDLQKMLEQLQKMFGGNGGEDENGEKGQGPDLQKMLEQFQKMFGGNGGEDENGEKGQGPDLQKMLEQFQKMFGGGGEDDGDEDQKPAKPKGRPLPRAEDKGGFVGIMPSGDADLAKKLGGAVVESVLEGGPADAAGLKKDDVIVAVDGVATPDGESLRREVSKKGPGARTVFTIDRARRLDATVVRERKDVTITIGKRPEGK
jgi:S1-C subfamily serine protease